MDNLILSLNVVLPLAIILCVGIVVKKCGILNESGLSQVNKLTFRVFLSTNLFMNIYTMDRNNLFNHDNMFTIIYAVCWILILILIPMLILRKRTKNRDAYPVIVQAIYRSNLVLFGLPVCQLLYPDENLSMIYLAIAIIVPLFNISAVIIFQDYKGVGVSFGKVLLNVLKNPLVVGAILGFLFWSLRIPVAVPIQSALTSMAKVATPLAFVVLGASIRFESLMGHLKRILALSFTRLVLVPAMVIIPGIMLGLRGLSLVTLMSIFASPAAVSSFTMAKEEGADEQLAAGVVAATTIMSIVTVFAWIFVLKNCNFI